MTTGQNGKTHKYLTMERKGLILSQKRKKEKAWHSFLQNQNQNQNDNSAATGQNGKRVDS